MLNKAFEFLRIADPQPSNEKVKLRTKSATELVATLAIKENTLLLMAVLQGVVAGFDSPVFTQDSSSVRLLIKAIKDHDALPEDLKENALELRAVAGMAIGELLEKSSSSDAAILSALAISAASLRAVEKDKHIRWMCEVLLAAANKGLQLEATKRRQRGTPALEQLNDIELPKESTEGDEQWREVLPAVKSALLEAKGQAAIDREEIETLWWMFTGFSEIEQKPLAKLSPSASAFVAGIELGERALLPPSQSAITMVERVVESGRKASTLVPVTLEDAIKEWTPPMLSGFASTHAKCDSTPSQCPALLPLSWACRRLSEGGDSPKLGKEFTAATGLALNEALPPAVWGAQVFRETILLRFLAGVGRN
jgi:hypothetical protein